jgi:hypothetical protein
MVSFITALKDRGKRESFEFALILEKFREDLLMSIQDEEKIDMLEALIQKIPIIRILPYILKAWEKLPEDKKEEYASIFLAALVKGASQYAGAK